MASSVATLGRGRQLGLLPLVAHVASATALAHGALVHTTQDVSWETGSGLPAVFVHHPQLACLVYVAWADAPGQALADVNCCAESELGLEADT